MPTLPLYMYQALTASTAPDKMLQGMQRYLKSPKVTSIRERERVATYDQSALYYYKAQGAATGALFIVPSLINGAEIFDLTCARSFIKYLTHQNIDVYLVEWGDLSAAHTITLDHLLQERLQTLWISAQKSACNISLHALGYCLGGTLLSTFFTRMREDVPPPVSLTFLATPFDFQAHDVTWDYVLQNPQTLKRTITTQGALSGRMMQSYFLSLQMRDAAEKFLSLADTEEGSAQEDLFIAVERWLNGGHDIPEGLALDILDRYFYRNTARQEIKTICEQHTHVCVITSETDRIVSRGSSALQYDVFQIRSACGHVGLMAGGAAQTDVWIPYLRWLKPIAMQQTQAL